MSSVGWSFCCRCAAACVQQCSTSATRSTGTSWYPGQWPESRWPADLELMQKAHIRVVRVGDIEWSRIEPSEGQYDLNWLERAINEAGVHGIYTVLSTATAAPPARLTEKYPETLRTNEDGSKSGVTGWDFNWDDAKYRELAWRSPTSCNWCGTASARATRMGRIPPFWECFPKSRTACRVWSSFTMRRRRCSSLGAFCPQPLFAMQR